MELGEQGRAYGLAFVSKRETLTVPEIEIEISRDIADDFDRWLTEHEDYMRRVGAGYLGQPELFFWPQTIQTELFGRDRGDVGYRSCGYALMGEDAWRIRLPLRQEHLKETVVTAVMLFEYLAGVPDERRASNRKQPLSIRMGCDRNGGHTSHPVTGEAFPMLRRWLLTQTPTALPEIIEKSMQEAWRAVVKDEQKKYARDCGAFVSSKGLFSLRCFGDACDVSMYPDMADDDPNHFCFYSCHNLDYPTQQLTLLAGLAKMSELVEKAE